MGSPPHARGIRQTIAGTVPEAGITPACAGNTIQVVLVENPDRDHPRMRGEYGLILAAIGPVLGSPPHARGIRELVAIHG